ncbi:hypothetical protein TSAR_016415 [Trichomalopsis sarcophagae]|uniref:Uncharacterized protein n=1 Tax=Trichomalopsis sarcophagae TaxID=543379 RepID=A0A232F2Z3_9HYME|nr:hypothetical protein TSAR_016415 [Trichomalopsis sarcophagae]
MLHNFLTTYSPWLDVVLHWNLNIPLHLQLKENEKNDFPENKGHKINEKVLLMYMIILWTILYSLSKKCLNVYFRNLGYALIRRNRIVNVLWSCGFTCVIFLYTVLLWNSLLKPELSVIIIKSFYIHYSGIILLNNNWLKGFSNIFFMLFIFGIPRQSLQPSVTSIFLLKSIDILILDLCRILYLRWPLKVKQFYSKTLYIMYCMFWTYLYMVYVPTNLLLSYKYQSKHEKLFLWLWFTTQYLDFVWLDFIRNFNSSHLLDLCLFSSPSAETIRLTKILKAHREIENRKSTETVAVKKELWQTLLCAMTMKKKINRLRKSKQAKAKGLSVQDDSGDTKETD